MLKNYFEINEETNISSFLKKFKDKKNAHYIILDTKPESFVDVRTIALRLTNLDEKLKGMKKNLSESLGTSAKDDLQLLIKSGDRVIKSKDNYYSFINALQTILDLEPDFLNLKLNEIDKKEVYALNENDKISSARSLFLKKRINILPVINGINIVGELRPIDLLVSDLFNGGDNGNLDYYTKKYKENVLNSSITNLVNLRPLMLNKNQTIRDAIKIMIKKGLPSLIVSDEINDTNQLYSVISYRDIFKLYKKDIEALKYRIEYVGSSELYDDEFDLIQDFAEKSIKKIANMSQYDNLKLSFKIIGDKDAGHKNRFIIKFLLSHGNNVIPIEKEISTGTADEIYNDKVKGKWNVPLIVQEGLKLLERKVIDEKKKKSNK